METFVGKFLIRRARMINGKEAFILCGTALPKNFSLETISDKDEIWLAELTVTDVKKYVLSSDTANGYHGGPEEFLEESPNLKSEFSEWKPKPA